MRSFTRMELSSPRRTPPTVFFPFPLCHQFFDALSEQSFIQDTWWLIPRVKKAVSLQFAFASLGYESEERGIVLCIAPIFVPFDEASINWWHINQLVSYCSRALAAPRFRPSWGVLGYVYPKEDLSTIAPVLWQQLLFVPLEVRWLCFVQKICQQLLPSSLSVSLSHHFRIAFKVPFPSLSGLSCFGPLLKLLNNIFHMVTFGCRSTIWW